jgi:serine/threonine-protein kinase RsbW
VSLLSLDGPAVPQPAAGWRLAWLQADASLAAPGTARRWAREVLAGWRAERELAEAVVLVVCELVTNSVKFAAGGDGAGVGVGMQVAAGAVVVEVTDSDGGEFGLELREAGADADGGRGLLIVDELCAGWAWFCPVTGRGRKTVRCVIKASHQGERRLT